MFQVVSPIVARTRIDPHPDRNGAHIFVISWLMSLGSGMKCHAALPCQMKTVDANSNANTSTRYRMRSVNMFPHHRINPMSTTQTELEHIIPSLNLPSDSGRAIDVGCGLGRDVEWLARAGFQAVGLDVRPETLAAASERMPAELDAQWVEGTASSLPFDDASCVLVADRGCLHHVAHGEVPAYASEVARVLVPGGAWVIRDMVGHAQQHHELDFDFIHALAHNTPLTVESCGIGDTPNAHHAGHQTLVAVLRRA